MAIDMEAILKDEGTYPDTLEIIMGTEKVSLGQIRDMSKKQQSRITEELSGIQRERQTLAQKQQEVLTLSERATETYNKLEEQLAKASRNAVPDGDPEKMWDTDQWYSPARKRISEIQKTIADLAETQKKLGSAVTSAVSIWMDDRWENEYSQVAPELEKYPKLAEWRDPEKLKKYASENKILDKRSMPSIREAVNRLTAVEREAAKSEDAYQRGLREGQMKARLGAQPRPASAAAAVVNGSGKVAETFEEAMSPDAVAQDSELNEMLANLGVNASQL